MRKYFVIFVLLAIGCQDNSRYVDPTVKPDDSNKIEQSITEAQKARATDAANIMRKLASAIDAGEISTMTEANSFTKSEAIKSQEAFNKIFAQQIAVRLNWRDDDIEVGDKLPVKAAEVFRKFADEFDAAAGKVIKQEPTSVEPKKRNNRSRSVRARH